MGYDFTFLRLKNKPDTFPFKLNKEFDFYGEMKEVIDPKKIERRLKEKTGFRANGKNDDGVYWYWWDTPDGGSLDIQLRPDCIAIPVDTHAHWKYVLELMIHLQNYMNDLLVMDDCTGTIYNNETYKDFIETSYKNTNT